ncbi:bolA-like protein 2 [Centruroides vittatus]|uniref:bolA-like protein 2 n=1 Tax=Centruroides sculpturatus TaxID=218467 RepID=UPI000C6EDF63|nr:bolA-like protein 2 [Centruroides sculpturatus]
MSNYTKDYIENKLKTELETTHVEVEDLSDGCGAKFNALIVTSKFDGKPLLQRHRMVNEVLKEEMKVIHAFTQKTLTPEQWEKQKLTSA